MKIQVKYFPVLVLTFIFSMGSVCANAQSEDKDFAKIKKLLYQQQSDWNNGDVDAFMQVYWKSPELQFGNANGITRGWQATLDGYKVRYPDRAAMGKLTFEVKDMTKHSKKVISLTGSWSLEREKDNPGGHFLLIWRKIKGEWRIVADHTSARS